MSPQAQILNYVLEGKDRLGKARNQIVKYSRNIVWSAYLLSLGSNQSPALYKFSIQLERVILSMSIIST